jgi:hypothetical protein
MQGSTRPASAGSYCLRLIGPAAAAQARRIQIVDKRCFGLP